MAGGLSRGLDNDCLSGVGHTEIGIGAHQPNYAIETRLEFDIDHDWKTRREIFVMPKVNIVTKSVTGILYSLHGNLEVEPAFNLTLFIIRETCINSEWEDGRGYLACLLAYLNFLTLDLGNAWKKFEKSVLVLQRAIIRSLVHIYLAHHHQ